MSTPTPEQVRAIAATGDTLVIAGAGTGKTRTLIERCLAHLTHPEHPVPLDAVLLVTFTDAAAAEMRQRLRAALQRQAEIQPDHPDLPEQLALIDAAHISTLHAFCLHLVRDHFHELNLDPELTLLDDDQGSLMAEEVLDDVLRRHYSEDTPAATVVQQFLLNLEAGRDTAARVLIRRVHDYTRTLPDPEGWFQHQEALLARQEPTHWLPWLHDAFRTWRDTWLPVLDAEDPRNDNAHRCATALRAAGDSPEREALAAALDAVAEADTHWAHGTKGRFRDPLTRFFTDAAFLRSLARTGPGMDPLQQDWQWMRDPMRALLNLAREFGERFAAARRELGAVDFHDLEQLALRLLRNGPDGAPSAVARRCRERFQLVFVDEYQDINPAQDAILRAIGREGPQANRFLVGDVKQSIYRFRLADPRIFQEYARNWGRTGSGRQVLPLTGNFRSHPGILQFVNALCAAVMRPEVGGVDYTPDQWLQPGLPPPADAPDPAPPPVELHLVIGGSAESHQPPAEPTVDAVPAEGPDDFSATEKEAWVVAQRLRTLHAHGTPVRDRDTGELRPVRWGDMAILLRSPNTRAEAYARMFERCGVPLLLSRGGFRESPEIADLLGLLQLLDNPLQDRPLAGVLRSPLAGFTPDEMAALRLVHRRGRLWTALTHLHRLGVAPDHPELPEPALAASAWTKADRFLAAFQRWRELTRVAPLSECLETILDTSGYETWLAAQPRATQGLANLRRLLTLTRQFDQFQRQGLHRFLRFIEARHQLDIELDRGATTASVDAVQFLSVHRAKGLEFPVVVVADLGHQFNLRDLSGPVLLDQELGLCPWIQAPSSGSRYPSLPRWLATLRERRDALGEELRLLYVALTRARDRLLLVATADAKSATEGWASRSPSEPRFTAHQLVQARTWLDWLGPWLCQTTGHTDWTLAGEHTLLQWQVHPTDALATAAAVAAAPDAGLVVPADPPTPAERDCLRARLGFVYPQPAATLEAAKVSVSQLRRRAAAQGDAEARPVFGPRSAPRPGDLAAVEIGLAHHRVLEAIALELPVTRQTLRNTITRLRDTEALSEAEASALDLDGLLSFWETALGRAVQTHHPDVHRELPFTVRFAAAELHALALPVAANLGPAEFFVVQGVADLAVIRPTDIWLVDFKTDRLEPRTLPERVKEHTPQLQLYALALSRIYLRPVTRRCLHFLSNRKTVEVGPGASPG